MTSNHYRSALVFAVALLGTGIAAYAVDSRFAAVVNGTPILESDFQKEFAEAKVFWINKTPASLEDPENVRRLRAKVLDELIARELLYQEGVNRGISVSRKEVNAGIEEIRGRFRVDGAGNKVSSSDAEAAMQRQLQTMGLSFEEFQDRLTKQVMARKVVETVRPTVGPVTDDDAREYFGRIRAFIRSGSTEPPADMREEEAAALLEVGQHIRSMTSERVRVSRILVRLSKNPTDSEMERARAAAGSIRRRLAKGEDFEVMAREESEDSESASKGGDLGWVVRGVAPPEFERVAFTTDPGVISPVFATEMGFNIIRVTERRAAEDPKYEQFREDLGRFLSNLRFDEAVSKFIAHLKDGATIEKHSAHIVVAGIPTNPEVKKAESMPPLRVETPKKSEVDNPQYKHPIRAQDFAIIIGIEKYRKLPSASFAERDAAAVRRHLKALGFQDRNIIELRGDDATKAQIQAYMNEWLPKNVSEDSNLFFYYSGHGAPDPETGSAFLVPVDGDTMFLKTTGIALREVYASLNKLKSKRIVVAMDSCFSGAGGRSVLPKGARPLVARVNPTGGSGRIVLMAAASGNQITGSLESEEHGMFTYYLLEALSNAGSAGIVDISPQMLFDHLVPRVRDQARRQNREQTPILVGSEESLNRSF